MSRKVIQKNLSYDTERRLYYVLFHEGSDGRGHRIRHTRTFRTYEEAVLAQEAGVVDRGEIPGKRCLLREWLCYWLEKVIARDHAASTLYGYRNIVRIHINPNLGDWRLRHLTPLVLQGYLNGRMEEGLSTNTTLKHYMLLHTALALAVQMELLERNPMDRVTPPKRSPTSCRFYTPAQIQALFAAVEGTWLELAVKLAGYLGLRRSEVCGLRWEHVDFGKRYIRIREVRTEIGGVAVTKAPKTASSARTLSIEGLQDLQAALYRAYEVQGRPESGYVVVLEDGQPPMPDQLTAALQNVVWERNLPKITMHGLRHSFASVANEAGVPMFDISKALGHSNIATTSTVYTHLFDETQEAAIRAVAEAIDPRP